MRLETKLALAITPDERYLLSGGSEKSIAIIDIENKALYYKFNNIHKGIVKGVKYIFLEFS